MKKTLATVLSLAICATMFAACGSSTKPAASTAGSTAGSTAASTAAKADPVTITVVGSYGAEDGNRANFMHYIDEYQKATGNTVKESSGTADEAWKAQVHSDFEAGAEPDVLFFFSGIDATPIIEQGKVVSVDEIRKVYPEYASNQEDAKMPTSPLDGKLYAVPVNGYWEAMYYNKTILEDCGVAAPGTDYSWDQFLEDCEAIKGKGYTPVAVSLTNVPHYWFEFVVLNNGSVDEHTTVPAASGDDAAKRWAAGLEDVKALYEAGYLPANTMTAEDSETCQQFFDGEAAFLIDGSWKYGALADLENVDDFVCTFPPAKGDRKTTDYIGGISMGYYITTKAWNDEAKRDAAVKFIETMTTDEAISAFSTAGNVTALKAGATAPADADSLLKSVFEMNKNYTGIAPAAQDIITGTQRDNLFANVKNVAAGKMTADAAIDEMLTK